MASTWQEYQEEVAAFFRSIGLDATTNHTVQGVRTAHDIDVFAGRKADVLRCPSFGDFG
jgi:hypothetical protein